MATYKELLAQKQALDARLEEARKSESAEAIHQVRTIVAEYWLTEADVFPPWRKGRWAQGQDGGHQVP